MLGAGWGRVGELRAAGAARWTVACPTHAPSAEMDPDSVDKVGAANLTQFVMQQSGDKELAMMMSAVRNARRVPALAYTNTTPLL